MQVLTELKQRGVQDILICCVDGLKGFPEAIEAIFPKTVVQTCVVHLTGGGAVQVMELWPPGAALQGEAPNHRERRRLRAGVVSVAEKSRP
jgi:mutator family transposase